MRISPKKILSLLLLTVLIVCAVAPVSALNEITVYVNGVQLTCDVPPMILSGRTMLPMRAVFEALEATVNWDGATRGITSRRGSTLIQMTVDMPEMTVNGETTTLDVAPTIVDGRTLVPVRAVAQALGATVNYDGVKRMVTIRDASLVKPVDPPQEETTTKEETTSKEETTTPEQGMTAVEISEMCAEAVFFVKIYDTYGRATKTGSGFFVGENGLAVTNEHVMNGAASASIHTIDGSTYWVEGIYDMDEGIDLCYFQVDGSHTYPYLKTGDSRNLKSGQNVFAIGSPEGLDNTISDGIISNRARTVEGYTVPLIQISVPISHGSSGGALLNDRGEVIGVTSAGYIEGQLLNFAVPIHYLSELDLNGWTALKTGTSTTPGTTVPPVGDVPGPNDHVVYETEPNNSISSGQEIINGTTVNGKLTAGTDAEDWFELYLPAGKLYMIFMPEYRSQANRIEATLYRDSESNLIDTSFYFNDSGYCYQAMVTDIYEAGTYQVKLADLGGTGSVTYEMYLAVE